MKKTVFLRSILIIFSSLILLTTSLLAEDKSDTEIQIFSIEEANKLIGENKRNPNFVILDVRTGDEFSSGHIVDAVNIDFKSPDFKDEVSKLDREKTYLTYCRSGRRSTAASEIMKEIGFQNIYMIEGGIIAWDNAELPIEQ